MMEILCEYPDEMGLGKYQVTRIVQDGVVYITTLQLCEGKPKRILAELCYKSLLPDYQSDLLSWENLALCSNQFGIAPQPDYMNYAVQNGKKPAATILSGMESGEAQRIIESLPESCGYCEYGPSMLWVYRKGCLADYYDLSSIKEIYDAHEVAGIDWDWVREMFKKPLSFFGELDEAGNPKCGFNIQSGGTGGKFVLTGLLLGYPVESTIANLRYKIISFFNCGRYLCDPKESMYYRFLPFPVD